MEYVAQAFRLMGSDVLEGMVVAAWKKNAATIPVEHAQIKACFSALTPYPSAQPLKP